MRRLDRPQEPRVLAEVRRKPVQLWEDLTPGDRADLQETLQEMQEGCCAYCEERFSEGKGHIDHFRKRADHPERTFAWENLFLSCNSERHCGRHKVALQAESRPDYALLIDPCRDDPEEFLVFLSDGRLVPRQGLSDSDERRAKETLRVFGLDAPGLVQRRRNLGKAFVAALEPVVSEGGSPGESGVEVVIEAFADKAGHPTLFRHLAGGGRDS